MLSPLELPDVFSSIECRKIVAAIAGDTFSDAGLVGGITLHNMRKARLCWLDEDGRDAWVFRRILDAVAEANRHHFEFRIDEFAEKMQVAWYGADPGGFFDWHIDYGGGPVAARRKLTIVVQLSDPADYEGGQLETNADGIVRSAPLAIGAAILFPSFVLHRVAPLVRGERYSLTTWCHGPAFQ